MKNHGNINYIMSLICIQSNIFWKECNLSNCYQQKTGVEVLRDSATGFTRNYGTKHALMTTIEALLHFSSPKTLLNPLNPLKF